jgi:adenine-specific DNA-methyltransferase
MNIHNGRIPTIRYLGNKRKLNTVIKAEINNFLPKGGSVIDLFAGSSSVGYYLLPNYRILANDVEKYAYCIAKALIEDCQTVLDSKTISQLIKSHFDRNLEELKLVFNNDILLEKRFSKTCGAPSEAYKQFCQKTPFIQNWQNFKLSSQKKKLFKISTNSHQQFPYALFSTYFMNSYFGVVQSIAIDSLRYAIDQIAGPYQDSQNPVLFYKLITALVYTLSYSVSSPGHFAQASSPNNPEVAKRLLNERKKDVLEVFLHYVDILYKEPRSNKFKNYVYNMDAFEFVEHLKVGKFINPNKTVIYVDPPYTADHYSRYYHVLNTLLLYDYPACIGKGRYRGDRYASPLSIKSVAPQTLSALMSNLRQLNLPVILSYTSTGILSVTETLKICKQSFKNVKVSRYAYNHSTQGRKLMSDELRLDRAEIIFTCEV